MSNATHVPAFRPSLDDCTVIHAMLTASVGLALLVFLSLAFRSPTRPGIVPWVGGPFVGAVQFFRKRHTFLWSNLAKHQAFKFKVLQHSVTAVSGDAGRKAFFTAKGSDLGEGFKLFTGGVPHLTDVQIDVPKELDIHWFKRGLITLLRKERLQQLLPKLLEDADARMKSWGQRGTFNPFTEVYQLVFSMTVAMGASRQLAQDGAAVKRLYELYWTLEKSSTPMSLLLPWLPLPSRTTKREATKDIVAIIRKHVEKSREEGMEGEEAIDALLRDGNDDDAVIQFVMGVLFAGVAATGMQSCWILLFLANAPKWRDQAYDEVKALLSQHSPTASDPLHKRLSAIPVSAWESETPVLDAITRESIRLAIAPTSLRRNMSGETIDMGENVTVGPGEFITYSMVDVHHDPEIYANPGEFDPGRFLAGREEDKVTSRPYPYVGWGVGNHPCSGMRVAKLELKAIVALFLHGYQYELVDGSGKKATGVTMPNRDDYFQARPMGVPVLIKYERVLE